MTTPETASVMGQIWMDRKNGRRAFIRIADSGIDLISFRYEDTGRICGRTFAAFKKQFEFYYWRL